jgi:glycosyltransferase involved in cell wall biosynthesis
MSAPSDLSIVYFGNDWFAENRTSSHHIGRRLGQLFPLLYVESPGLRVPTTSRRDLRKLIKKLFAAFRTPQQIDAHMWYISVPQIPLRRFLTVRRLNQSFASWRIQRSLRMLGFSFYVSWFTVPHPGFLAGRLGERMVVYYCIDNYSALPDVDSIDVARMDAQLSRRADLVFAASPTLTATKQKQNSNVIYSPHGVDAELFAQAADLSRPVAERARGLSHPIIGFFGVLDARIDSGLLQFLAKSRPQWSFLLVGRVAINAAPLASLPNICLPGAISYSALPDWARAFDVCIMPYCRDAFSENANPLKLREYLATGKPVVSIPIPELEQFGNLVSVATTSHQFLEAIEHELATDSDDRRRERMSAVSSSTWDIRIESVIRALFEGLENRAR